MTQPFAWRCVVINLDVTFQTKHLDLDSQNMKEPELQAIKGLCQIVVLTGFLLVAHGPCTWISPCRCGILSASQIAVHIVLCARSSGSNLKTHLPSVHVWSVHVHKCCLYSERDHVHSVPENTYCLYRQLGRPFLFWPVILNFFSSKNRKLTSSSRAVSNQPRCSWPLPIKYNSKPMTNNLFHVIISLRRASGSSAFVGLEYTT